MPKKRMALTKPAVAGSMKLFMAICHCRAHDSYQGMRLDSCEIATFKRRARSAGAGLRPSEAITRCVRASAALSSAHERHDSVWRETVCISAPVSALSRYEESMARTCSHWACVEFISPPQQRAHRAHVPARLLSFTYCSNLFFSAWRPRIRRDFTVPSDAPVTSAISSYERSSMSRRITVVRYGSLICDSSASTLARTSSCMAHSKGDSERSCKVSL